MGETGCYSPLLVLEGALWVWGKCETHVPGDKIVAVATT